MSEYNFSISSRRSSAASRTASTFSDHEFTANAFKKSNWFDAYVCLKENDKLFFDKHHLLIDEILKLLFDDTLTNEVVIHLLSLLEHFYHCFHNADLLEQVIGSLLNAYSIITINKEIKVKYLYTITTLIVTNIDIAQLNDQLELITRNFIMKLIGNICKDYLAEASTECLMQFEEVLDNKLFNLLKDNKLEKNNILLFSLLLKNNQLRLESQTEVAEILMDENLDPFLQIRTLIEVFNFIKINTNQNIISANFFKPFLNNLIYSKELPMFHLALDLLKNFDLTFSSYGEKDIINQLFTLCVHPSLITSHRLMMLDFAEHFVHFVPRIKNYINLNIFEFCDVLDGSDTQEKKLKILLQTNIEDEILLTNLKPLKAMCLIKNNNRASNSLYRCLNSIIKTRPSMINKIEYLILSMILKSPSRHISRTISLLKLNPELTENLLKLIIEETNNHFDNFQNENDLKQYFLAFEWILNKTQLDDNSNLIILNFLLKKSEKRPNLFKGLLACCAAIIYRQTLNDKIRLLLRNALDYLSEKGKKNMELVSWAQIYLFAIDALPNQENFSKVFEETELKKEDNLFIELSEKQFPIAFEKVKSKKYEEIKNFDRIDRPFQLNLNLAIKEEFQKKFPILFCVDVLIKIENQNIQNVRSLAILRNETTEQLVFDLKPKLIDDFKLTIYSRFTDSNGKIYQNSGFKINFKFSEIIQTSCLAGLKFNELWNRYSNEEKTYKSVIILSNLKTIDEFYEKFKWLSEFRVDNSSNFLSFLVPSSFYALIKLFEINQLVNLRIMTNNFYTIYRLEQELNV